MCSGFLVARRRTNTTCIVYKSTRHALATRGRPRRANRKQNASPTATRHRTPPSNTISRSHARANLRALSAHRTHSHEINQPPALAIHHSIRSRAGSTSSCVCAPRSMRSRRPGRPRRNSTERQPRAARPSPRFIYVLLRLAAPPRARIDPPRRPSTRERACVRPAHKSSNGRARAPQKMLMYWFIRPRWSCEMHSAIQTMLRISCSLSFT